MYFRFTASAPQPPVRHRRVINAAAALGAAAVLGLSGCSALSGNARLDTVEASGDGTLRIGLILDSSGKQSFLNASQLAAAKLAVNEINAAGGHKGKAVELLPERVGEDSAALARELVEAKADVVIGPTDSSRAGAAIDVLSKAKIPLVSPGNTAAGLSRYNSGGYYFRTAAADVAQGPVLAKLAKDGGAAKIAVLHEAGNYGSDVATAVSDAARAAGLDPAASVEFKPGSAREAAQQVAGAAPDAVVVVAREDAQGALAELNNAGIGGEKLILSDGAVSQYGSGLASKALEKARGVLPGVFPSAHFQGELVAVDPSLKDMTFAAETYDAVNLAAIAAAKAQDDAGPSIAANLIAVSGGDGTVCRTYQQCLEAAKDGKPANYDGESGAVGFDSNGDVTSANFMVFTYGADNLPKMSGSETAARAAG